MIKELKKEQTHDDNNANHWDVDAFSGYQPFMGMSGQMADDDGHSKINFDELEKLWEHNLEIKVMAGKRKAFERD